MATQRRSQKSTNSNHRTPPVEQENVQPNTHASEDSEEIVAQVHELKETLEQSQQNEKSLQATIEQLRSQIENNDAQVHELKETLEQSQQQEKSLQKTIEQLRSQVEEKDKSLQETIKQVRSQVEEHDATVKHLQANVEEAQHTALRLAESNQTLIEENKQLKATVEKADRLQAELEKAQQAAHKLAESNQSLLEENKTLKEKQQTEQKTQLATAKTEADLRSHQDILKKRQAASLAHPVFPDSPAPAKVSDQEIGWFD